eukprot:gene10517-7303_t
MPLISCPRLSILNDLPSLWNTHSSVATNETASEPKSRSHPEEARGAAALRGEIWTSPFGHTRPAPAAALAKNDSVTPTPLHPSRRRRDLPQNGGEKDRGAPFGRQQQQAAPAPRHFVVTPPRCSASIRSKLRRCFSATAATTLERPVLGPNPSRKTEPVVLDDVLPPPPDVSKLLSANVPAVAANSTLPTPVAVAPPPPSGAVPPPPPSGAVPHHLHQGLYLHHLHQGLYLHHLHQGPYHHHLHQGLCPHHHHQGLYLHHHQGLYLHHHQGPYLHLHQGPPPPPSGAVPPPPSGAVPPPPSGAGLYLPRHQGLCLHRHQGLYPHHRHQGPYHHHLHQGLCPHHHHQGLYLHHHQGLYLHQLHQGRTPPPSGAVPPPPPSGAVPPPAPSGAVPHHHQGLYLHHHHQGLYLPRHQGLCLHRHQGLYPHHRHQGLYLHHLHQVGARREVLLAELELIHRLNAASADVEESAGERVKRTNIRLPRQQLGRSAVWHSVDEASQETEGSSSEECAAPPAGPDGLWLGAADYHVEGWTCAPEPLGTGAVAKVKSTLAQRAVLLHDERSVLRSEQLLRDSMAEKEAAMLRLLSVGGRSAVGGEMEKDKEPRSCLRAVAGADEGDSGPCVLNDAAKQLFSALLYVRALGGFPTLVRVGPLAMSSRVVDKESCLSSAAHGDAPTMPGAGPAMDRRWTMPPPPVGPNSEPRDVPRLSPEENSEGVARPLEQALNPVRLAGAERTAGYAPVVQSRSRSGLRVSCAAGQGSAAEDPVGDALGLGDGFAGAFGGGGAAGSSSCFTERDEICVVVRAMVATKSRVERFGISEVVHVLPPLPRNMAVDLQAARGAGDRGQGSAFSKLLRKRQDKKNRPTAPPPGALGDDGTPLPPDYGDIVVALLQSPGDAAAVSSVPAVAELESLRYRIFASRPRSPRQPLGLGTRSSLRSSSSAGAEADPALEAYATQFPLYQATSIGELTLEARRRGLAVPRLGDAATAAERAQITQFKRLNLKGFYKELLGAVQYALLVQVHKTRGRVMHATYEF